MLVSTLKGSGAAKHSYPSDESCEVYEEGICFVILRTGQSILCCATSLVRLSVEHGALKSRKSSWATPALCELCFLLFLN